jgi:hypothetical protein
MKGKLRFLSKIAMILVLFLLVASCIGYITNRMGEGWGLFWAILAGISLGLGVTLFYWVLVDWRNLKIARKHKPSDLSGWKDRELVCVSGTAKVDGVPLISPFTKTLCAVYQYEVITRVRRAGDSTSTTQKTVAQGFHMKPTRIEGQHGSIRLSALPEMDSGLVDQGEGKWPEECKELLNQLIGNSDKDYQINRQAAELEAYIAHDGEVYQDYCMAQGVGDTSSYVMKEKVLPTDQPVTVIGCFNSEKQALTGERARLGPNLIAYKGTYEELIERLEKEVPGYMKGVFTMVGFAIAVMAYATFMA